MRIFLAGGLGVIGRRVAPLLVRRGHEVVAAVPSQTRGTVLAATGTEPRVIDLFDERDVRKAVQGSDVVVNVTSQLPRISRAWRSGAWIENDRFNRQVTRDLVTASIESGVGRFIQESTVLVYEDNGDDWISEESPTAVTRVTQSVFSAEREVERFTEAGGIGVVLRMGNLYSPDSPATRSAVRAARRGFGTTVGVNDGYVSMIHADDAAAAVAAALDIPAGCYNVVEDEPGTKLEQMDAIAGALGLRRLNSGGLAIAALGGARTRALSRSLRVSNRKLREASRWVPMHRSPQEGWLGVVAATGA